MESRYQEEEFQQDFGGVQEEPEVDIPEEEQESGPESEGESVEAQSDSSDDVDSEVVEQEKKPKKKNKDSYKSRFNQVRREKYEALDALNRLKEENFRLQSMAELSSQAAMRQYDDNVMQNIEKARQAVAQAIESGDVQAQTDAYTSLAAATNELQSLNSWKAQQTYKQQYNPQATAEPYYQAAVEQNLQRWVEENSWSHPDSEDYDSELTEQLHLYCNAFDNNLYRAGHGDKIMSPEYLQVIDEHINTLRKNRQYSNQGRGPSMRNTRSSVAPVRNGYSSAVQQQDRVRLSADEKEMIRRLGVKENDYINKREQDKKKQAQRGYR